MYNHDELREQITQIEQKIRTITGNDVCSNSWIISQRKREQIEKLLHKRKEILNAMFVATPEEVERMEQVNARLFDLTKKMYARINALYHHMATTTYDPEFDDDVEVEGKLFFTVNGEDSILPMHNDDYYGSDFYSMLNQIDVLSNWLNKYYGVIEECTLYLEPLLQHPKDGIFEFGAVDELNSFVWHIPHPQTRDKFSHLRICYAIYHICDYGLYSIPDVLRMNDFWVEVAVKHQHIVELDGTRYNRFEHRRTLLDDV